MTLQDFITKYTGQFVDFDGAFGPQCVDLMNQYCVDVLNIPNPIQVLPGGTAYEIYSNYNGTQFTKIANTPTGVPTAGDIVFFDTTWGNGAGHVVMFEQGDTNTFTSFEQNDVTAADPNGSCETLTHNYNGVAGWLHPNTAPATTTTSDLTPKAVQYDNIAIFLHNKGYLQSANTNDYMNNNGVLSAVELIYADDQLQRTRAGWYDQVCSSIGLSGDTTKIDNTQVIAQIDKTYVPVADWNAIAADLGLPAGSTKDAVDAAVKTLQANEQKDSQTVTSQNQQISQLTTSTQSLTAQVESLQKQLGTANTAANEPTTNIPYQQLYTQAEQKVTQLQAQLQTAQKTLSTQQQQYQTTSALLMPKKQLVQTFFSRLFSGN